MGEHPGVVGPVDGGGRALRAGEIGDGGTGVDVDAVHAFADAGDGEADGAVRHVDDHVHAVALDPLLGDAGAHVRLVLVVADDDLDGEVMAGRLEFGDGLAHGSDGDRAAEVAIDAGFVAQHANLQAGGLRTGARAEHGQGAGGSSRAQKHASCDAHHVPPNLLFVRRPTQRRAWRDLDGKSRGCAIIVRWHAAFCPGRPYFGFAMAVGMRAGADRPGEAEWMTRRGTAPSMPERGLPPRRVRSPA